MCNSAIYINQSANPLVQPDDIIPLGTTIRRFGCDIKQDGNTVSLCDSGYYKVDVIVTATASATDPLKVVLERNGAAVIGGFAEVTPAAVGTQVVLPISVIVRDSCRSGDVALAVRLENAEAKILNMTTVVEKL